MRGFVFVKVAGLFIAAALLASCYAPLVNQEGYLSFDLKFAGARAGTNEVIGLVVNADYENEFKELLYLINQGEEATFTGSDTDRLVELGQLMATTALVKFGGFPFFDTTIDPAGGSFELIGIPAGRSYFVKLFVFDPGVSFKVEDIDENFADLLTSENFIFDSEDAWPTTWQNWQPTIGPAVEVKAGESVDLIVTLLPRTDS